MPKYYFKRSSRIQVKYYGDVVEDSWSDNFFIEDRFDENLIIADKKSERYRGYWKILSRWLEINLQGKSVCAYLEQEAVCNIAVYGLGLLGKPLVREMYNHGLRIAYGIDQDEYKEKTFDFPVYQLQDTLPKADIVIITVEYAFYSIKQQLMEKSNCKINVNNLTQATTTYSVSFNWHGIPCAFLYL